MAERFMLQDRSGVDQRQADGQFFELPGDTTVLQEPQGPVGGAQQSLQFGNKAQANPWPFHLGDSGMHSLRPPSRSGGAAMSFIPPKQANPWPYHGHENDSDRPASSDSAKEGENEQRGCTATETSYSPNASPDEGASLVLPTHEHPVVEDQEMRDVSLPVGTVDASLVPAPLKIPRPRSSSALPCDSGYSNGYRDVVRPTHLNVRSDGGSEESYWRFPEKGSSPMEPAKDSCLAMTENAPYVSSPNASIDFVSANSESLPSSLPAMTFHGSQECSAQNIDSERPTASMGDATEYNSGEVVAQRRSAVALEDDSPHASSLVSKKAENLDTGGTMVDGYTPFSPTPGGQKLQYRHPTGLAHGAGNGSNPASEPRPPYPGSERAKLSDGLESRGGLDCTMSLEYQEHEQDMKRDDPQQGNRVSTGGLRPPPKLPPRPVSVSHLPMGFNQQQTSSSVSFPPPPKRRGAPSLPSPESHRVSLPTKLFGSSSAKRWLDKTNQVIEGTLDSVLQGGPSRAEWPANVASLQSMPARRLQPSLSRGQHQNNQKPIPGRPGNGSRM